LGQRYEFTTIIAAVLLFGISASIVSIIFSIWTFKIQKYRYAMVYDAFYRSNSQDDFDSDTINSYGAASQDLFYDTMIETYLRCIRHNSITNAKKSTKVLISQLVFLSGIFSIPTIITILITHLPAISTTGTIDTSIINPMIALANGTIYD
jgi:hypothetical protein